MKAPTVAIIDDEPLARERLRSLLAPLDVRVVGEAGSVAEAVQLLSQAMPDIVLLDIEMPDGTGFDVLDQLGDTPLPLVIIVTAYDSHALRAFDAAAVDYVL